MRWGALNVATTIQSDEALVAAGFSLTIQFFNTHFRPEEFPIDTVIFTEGVPVPMPPSVPVVAAFRRQSGDAALTIGLLPIVLILYAGVMGCR